jgi:hypothetical protein
MSDTARINLTHCEIYGHYCPICDNSFKPQDQRISELEARNKELEAEVARLSGPTGRNASD